MKLTKTKLKQIIREELLNEESDTQISVINTDHGKLSNTVDGEKGVLKLDNKVIATYEVGGGGVTKGKVKDFNRLIDAIGSIIWEKGRHS